MHICTLCEACLSEKHGSEEERRADPEQVEELHVLASAWYAQLQEGTVVPGVHYPR
jgi:hypothetical protein